MFRLCAHITWLVLAFCSSTASHAAEQSVPPRRDRVLLIPKQNSKGRVHQLHHSKGRRLLKEFQELGGIEVVELTPGEDLTTAIEQYRSSGEVEFAEPDYKLHAA